MNKAKQWVWTVIGHGMTATGEVTAVDPRDAFSRALTSAAADSEMTGQKFKISADILHSIPANGDKFHERMVDTVYMAVREIDGAKHVRTMLELRALWEILRDVPVMDRCDELPDGSIGTAYLQFSKGTPREDIWYWFEAQNPAFVVGDALMGVWPN